MNPPAGNGEEATAPTLFHVVGIGASAGGLEAVSELLQNIPENSGAAFVIVQHLARTYPSNLAEILSHHANIPIEEVREGTVVQPNCAYVIPPDADVFISNGTLHLAPRQAAAFPHLPVDRFLSSLAADAQRLSVGVILSGTASDGVEGCKLIKEVGGVTFAQTELSAKYSGMPHSAISAGCVDFVLSPKQIAAKIVELGSYPYVSSETASKAPLSQDDLNKISKIVSRKMGVDFSQYKITTLRRRVQRRMALYRFDDIKEYLGHLKQTPKEIEDLYRDILITVTSFFREREAFEVLKKAVLGPLFAHRDGRRELRIWVPGCATGEEAYSIAIVLMEFLSTMEPKNRPMSVQLFATDINEHSLAKARLGVYSEAIAKDLTPGRLKRFFVKQDGMYHVHPLIREMCVFAKQNVAKDPPFSNLDLISCRNLLIYFGEQLQTRVIPAFHYALRPGGYLMLGGSETLGKFADQFSVVDKKHRIYQKKKDSPRLLTHFAGAGFTSLDSPSPVFRPHSLESAHSLERQFDRALLEMFGPTGIVVTDQLEIVHLRGNTGDFLVQPSGQPSFNLSKMARGGLMLDLRAAVKEAKESGIAVKRENVEIQTDHGSSRVDVVVHPFTPSGSRERYYIIGFAGDSARALSAAPPIAVSADDSGSTDASLTQELAHAKDQLRMLIEDHEVTLEEYRSSNEEVLSANEELQSLNEEMETAKEELQSTNEELRTLNEELHNRNSELTAATDDLSNLFSNVRIPLLMVTTDLTIRRFTPEAEPLLNLRSADIGRNLAEIRPNLRSVNLADIAGEVISSVTTREMEVQASDGTWNLMQVRAYKTSGHLVAGVVFAFLDIDFLKRSLDDSRVYTNALIESARESILILDSNLRVVKANNAFYKTFQVEPSQTEGTFIYELGRGEWNISQLKALLENILPTHSRVDNFEVRAEFPNIGNRIMRLNARRVESQAGKEVILLAIEDGTDLKRSEDALRELSRRLLNIEDTERRRIAGDLHDITGRKVAALALNLRRLAKADSAPESNRHRLKEAQDLADQITNEVRGLSYVLHPPTLDELGLPSALREYVEGISKRTDLRIDLTIQDEFPRLPDELNLTLFRIIQEALTNVQRHAGAHEARIQLLLIGNAVELLITDSRHGQSPGASASPSELKRKAGAGIARMKKRVAYLRGTLKLRTGASGTTVVVRIPVPTS